MSYWPAVITRVWVPRNCRLRDRWPCATRREFCSAWRRSLRRSIEPWYDSAVPKVDLYNNTYGNSAAEAYREVRLETYGQDLGQTSWTTLEEFREIIDALELRRDSSVLEIGSGAGGCAIHFAEVTGCRITGLDVNPEAVKSATSAAQSRGLRQSNQFSPA